LGLTNSLLEIFGDPEDPAGEDPAGGGANGKYASFA